MGESEKFDVDVMYVYIGYICYYFIEGVRNTSCLIYSRSEENLGYEFLGFCIIRRWVFLNDNKVSF